MSDYVYVCSIPSHVTIWLTVTSLLYPVVSFTLCPVIMKDHFTKQSFCISSAMHVLGGFTGLSVLSTIVDTVTSFEHSLLWLSDMSVVWVY
jgi:hypothetical protein